MSSWPRMMSQAPDRSSSFRLSRRTWLVGTACLAVAGIPAAAEADLVQSGTVTISQTQIAFIGSGNLGGGQLVTGGKTYSFSIGGLGVGGFGISKIEAYGVVYNMKTLADFPGGYVQARYGAVVGSASTGELWLQNARGVVLKLDAKRTGLALSLGGDAVYIDFD